MQIEIDFDVYKAITLRRETEEMTPNDVLRSILSLPPSRAESKGIGVAEAASGAMIAAGRVIPSGTQLRTVYKGRQYSAEIVGGMVVSEAGKSFQSLSAAAYSITGSNVNGLRFWKAKCPGADWVKVTDLPVTVS